MTLALLRQLEQVREGKLAQAEREHRERLHAAAEARARRDRADAEVRALIEGKRALQARWRAQRLARESFVHDDCLAQDAALVHSERRIEAGQAVLQQAETRLEAAMQAAQQARAVLARCRIDLAKAGHAVARERERRAQREEAREEDELDELALLTRGAARPALQAEGA